MNWLQKLLCICDHKWETAHTHRVLSDDGVRFCTVIYVQRCTKCGLLHQERIDA